ncbi:receptor-type tyrosine-protein phosphatase epsilon-like [Mytilus galloprovincialis]|uniref:receptor-type tyrosine-protein phosphatase epsilon-like n=1 Tax=Mytilus galloprovincialis TaxID=29158 RepID=UPI003F7CC51F
MAEDDVLSTVSNTTTGSNDPINYTVQVLPRPLLDDNSREIVIWSLVCACITLVALGLATCKYFRDRYDNPESKRKRKERSEKEKKEKEEKAVTAVKKEPIAAEQFIQRFKQKKSDKYLKIEVRAIVRNQDEFPCTIAMMPDNILLNVNQDVVSFDHSRVILKKHPPEEDSDYINASFIDGYCKQKEYIATQGPRQKTIPCFWHMVWQENVHCIVMATGLFENANQQCDKYWGDVFSAQRYVRHGDIHIWLDATMEMAQLTVRSFRIQHEGSSIERKVKHFEMVGFNDEATDPGFILDVCRRVNNHVKATAGPILVHCRCGGGKTAVFIAIDYCLKQLQSDASVDIYSTVLHLRKFRKNMVRSLFQYRLIYESVSMHIQCGATVMTEAEVPIIAQYLSKENPKSKMSGFEKEFQTIRTLVPKLSIGDCAGGHRSENRNKSRDIMLLPPERARPYLLTAESGDNGTDFINAVFVDGYYQENNFLVTQWPMQHTVNDVWRLIYDYKITSLVVLNEQKFSRKYPCFWPSWTEDEQKFGPIAVRFLASQKLNNITVRAFSIRKNLSCMPMLQTELSQELVTVRMFHLTCWLGREKDSMNSKSLIYLMELVEQWQHRNNPLNPVCVMSKDGMSRCGVYCVANICCDQLKAEGEVDVFGAVRVVKKNRPALIPNVMEYIFSYSLLVSFLAMMQENKPKIVITGPAAKEGQINRGYGLLETQNSHMLLEDQLDEISRSSQLSFYTAGDQTPSMDGICLAARGHIATCKRPVTQLQIPHTDISSNSSSDSNYENAMSNNSSRQNSVRLKDSRKKTNGKMNGSPNISMGNGSVSSKLVQVDRRTKPSVCRSPSAQSMEYYTPHKVPSISSSKTRRPKPALKRQDATDELEMISIDIENQNHVCLSSNLSHV